MTVCLCIVSLHPICVRIPGTYILTHQDFTDDLGHRGSGKYTPMVYMKIALAKFPSVVILCKKAIIFQARVYAILKSILTVLERKFQYLFYSMTRREQCVGRMHLSPHVEQ
jgi:hypothetical protein